LLISPHGSSPVSPVSHSRTHPSSAVVVVFFVREDFSLLSLINTVDTGIYVVESSERNILDP
jgi:hypothetical protein